MKVNLFLDLHQVRYLHFVSLLIHISFFSHLQGAQSCFYSFRLFRLGLLTTRWTLQIFLDLSRNSELCTMCEESSKKKKKKKMICKYDRLSKKRKVEKITQWDWMALSERRQSLSKPLFHDVKVFLNLFLIFLLGSNRWSAKKKGKQISGFISTTTDAQSCLKTWHGAGFLSKTAGIMSVIAPTSHKKKTTGSVG